MKRATWMLAALALLLCGVGQARAQFRITITADENGNGALDNTAGFHAALPSTVGPDTGPGGRLNALLYDMLNPPGLTTGDVFVTDTSGVVSDVIRFNATSFTGGPGEFVFYSLPGGTDLADLAGFPTANYANTLTISEVNGMISYTPTAGQPGFVTGAGGPVTYNLTSGGVTAVPEPATLTMLGIGSACMGAWGWRRRKQSATVTA